MHVYMIDTLLWTILPKQVFNSFDLCAPRILSMIILNEVSPLELSAMQTGTINEIMKSNTPETMLTMKPALHYCIL